MTRTTTRIGWSFMFVFATLTTIMVSRYLTMDPDVYFPDQREIYITHKVGITAHVLGGVVAMMIGPFQFIPALRTRKKKLHRALGITYLIGCALGGSAGLYMAFFAYGGFPSGLGLGFLAVVWMSCGGIALARALAGKFDAHREWMIRSYALTLAAFTLRIWLPVHGVLDGTGVIDVPFQDAYIAVTWGCWVPNLMVAEIFINMTRRTSPVAITSPPITAQVDSVR